MRLVSILATALMPTLAVPAVAQPPSPSPPPPFMIQLTGEQLQQLWAKICPEDCQRTQVLMQDIQRQVGEQSAARAKAAEPKKEDINPPKAGN